MLASSLHFYPHHSAKCLWYVEEESIMAKREKIFRVVSLFLVGIGFIVVVSGVDRNGGELTTLESFVEEIKSKEEIEVINSETYDRISISKFNFKK